MSVSNAFRSNTFNIFVALALPWAVGCYMSPAGYYHVEKGDATASPFLWATMVLNNLIHHLIHPLHTKASLLCGGRCHLQVVPHLGGGPTAVPRGDNLVPDEAAAVARMPHLCSIVRLVLTGGCT